MLGGNLYLYIKKCFFLLKFNTAGLNKDPYSWPLQIYHNYKAINKALRLHRFFTVCCYLSMLLSTTEQPQANKIWQYLKKNNYWNV